MNRTARRKLLTLGGILFLLGVMTTIVSYSVTIYRLFCSVTGALGTTGRVVADTAHVVAADKVTVSFDTNIAPGMPWYFRPLQDSITVALGQESLVFFEAENLSDHAIVGHATFNVVPEQVGQYFKKIQCFCFTDLKLAAGAKAKMPVVFFVDPRLSHNPETRDIHQITLSYTFFPSLKPQGAFAP